MSIELAYRLYFQGKINDAKRLLKRIIERTPNAKAYFLYALIMFREGNLSESEDAINKAVELELGFYEAWILRAKILLQQKRYQEALDSLDRAYEYQLELEEYTDYEIFILKAKILFEMGHLDLALEELNKAKELNPFDDDLIDLEKKIKAASK